MGGAAVFLRANQKGKSIALKAMLFPFGDLAFPFMPK